MKNNPFQISPIEQISFKNQKIFIKRDDLLSDDFSGNKARKLYYYLINDFPDIKKVISYGSVQSNAMYSLSVLAKLRGWKFDYLVNHIPSYLEVNPEGNYKYALENGMNLIIGENISEVMAKAKSPVLSLKRTIIDDNNTIFIQEGGRDLEAKIGIDILASEIIEWCNQNNFTNLKVMLPSGTGTTALFLSKALNKYGIKVYTTPCVGDKEYLLEQFKMLEEDSKYYPDILLLDKKYHFGKLYKNNYEIWLELKENSKIEFDLLYDPKGWLVIEKYSEIFDEETLYIHQGGLIGNESMIKRYKRKYSSNN